MPKIIKDVENIIRSSATELFVELNYTKVDMKMIAKKSGVAVGTLYNYYENKKQLYISILTESWENTFSKLDSIVELTIPSHEKLRKLASILYEDVEERRGLGKTLINTSIVELKDDNEINNLKNRLISIMENFFKNLNKVNDINKYYNIDKRLAEVLLVFILSMFELHPNNKEDNINFLVEFISLSIN